MLGTLSALGGAALLNGCAASDVAITQADLGLVYAQASNKAPGAGGSCGGFRLDLPVYPIVEGAKGGLVLVLPGSLTLGNANIRDRYSFFGEMASGVGLRLGLGSFPTLIISTANALGPVITNGHFRYSLVGFEGSVGVLFDRFASSAIYRLDALHVLYPGDPNIQVGGIAFTFHFPFTP